VEGWLGHRGRFDHKRIRKVHDFLTVGAPTPLQHAAAFALDMPVTYYTDLAAKYLKSRDRLFKMLKSAGFEPSLPKELITSLPVPIG